MRRWMRRIGGAVGAVLLCGAVALFVGVTVLPRVFGIELRTVVSGSMEPAVEKGSLVVAMPVSASDLELGDVILFRAPDGSGRLITHRIAAINNDNGVTTLETRGDANNKDDPWSVPANDVVGKVRGDIPRVGYLIERVRSRTGFLVLMVLPALIVIAGEASVWRRFLRERRGQRVTYAAPSASSSAFSPNPYLDPGVRSDQLPARRPSGFLAAAAVMTIAIGAIGGVMFALAPRPDTTSGERRVASETVSIAGHSQSLADGEAFDGDIQMLRNAEDPRLRDPETQPEDRVTALRQMLFLNTNRFDALAVVDSSGRVIATTDEMLAGAATSAAFTGALKTGGVAVSDIVPASGDLAATIDYAVPVRDVSGAVQAILVGRASPTRVWGSTVATKIDGGRNVITDAKGEVVAGLDHNPAPTSISLPGASAARWTLAGVPSVCAASPIGAGTHLDHGWNVVSCLPVSLAEPGWTFPQAQFLVNTIAVVLVGFSATVLVLAWLLGERGSEQASQASSGLKAIEARLLAQREVPGSR